MSKILEGSRHLSNSSQADKIRLQHNMVMSDSYSETSEKIGFVLKSKKKLEKKRLHWLFYVVEFSEQKKKKTAKERTLYNCFKFRKKIEKKI